MILVMLLSGTIGVLFQFVFRNQDSGWNPTRIIETLFIAFSRLANSTFILTQPLDSLYLV